MYYYTEHICATSLSYSNDGCMAVCRSSAEINLISVTPSTGVK